MGYVYFSGNEEKIIDSILNIEQNKYGIKGVKIGVIIPMNSQKMPYFISTCQLYFDDDDPSMRKTVEEILNLIYDMYGSEVSALIYEEIDYYVRTISIKNTIYTHCELVFYGNSFDNLANKNLPSDSSIRWQIYEGRFEEVKIKYDDVVEYVNTII